MFEIKTLWLNNIINTIFPIIVFTNNYLRFNQDKTLTLSAGHMVRFVFICGDLASINIKVIKMTHIITVILQ